MVDENHMPALDLQYRASEYPLRLLFIGFIEMTKSLDIYNYLFGDDYAEG